MSRSATIAAAVACLMVGCSLLKTADAPLPVQPPAPTQPENMTKVGDQIDKSDARVAAAVTVARNNADKADIVRAETSVALSYLPAPSPADVAFAEKRAAAKDEKAYAEAVAYGKKLLASIDANWAKMEADQKEAKRVSDLKDARIKELTAEIDRVKKDASKNLWTMAGVAVAVIGALATAFASPKVGIPLLACGAAIGAFPFIVDSPYFGIIAGSTLAIAAIIGLWYLWDIVRDKVHASDEQAPPKV